MTTPNIPWKTVKSQTVFESRWLTVLEDDVINPEGKPGKYTYTQSPPFVLIVPFNGKHFTFVRQYRYPLKRFMIEFPGGSIDENETPLDAAKREFKEETGIIAQKWTQLGTICNPNLATVFLAEELIPTSDNEMNIDGISEFITADWSDIDQLIKDNQFTDSKTLAALMLFERHTR